MREPNTECLFWKQGPGALKDTIPRLGGGQLHRDHSKDFKPEGTANGRT
jgi:hypothetical protein